MFAVKVLVTMLFEVWLEVEALVEKRLVCVALVIVALVPERELIVAAFELRLVIVEDA